jgi:glycerol-3-phosphate dehydrogenase
MATARSGPDPGATFRLSAAGTDSFDLIVIGGGVNGAGIARDAARRGLRTCLIEQADLCNGTSRWSSRLIHGGLRYLEHAEFGLVRESLREREILLRVAPHLVRPLQLMVPVYAGARRGPAAIRAGMWLYDLLSWGKSLPRHRMLDRRETLALAPALAAEGLLGAASYYDAQATWPERLVVENALDLCAAGGELRTWHRVDRVLSHRGDVTGVRCTDLRGDLQLDLRAPLVINASGPWVDRVLQGVGQGIGPFLGGTKGTHIVLRGFQGAPELACYAEAAADGRPFFVIPWNGLLLVGTTDIRYAGNPAAAAADDAEIDYLLAETGRLFPSAAPARSDVLYHYTGVRPLPRQQGRDEGAITRRHVIRHHRRAARGLYSVIGGKLTTYRSLAEEVVDRAVRHLGISVASCTTRDTPLPGAAGDLALAGETLRASGLLSAPACERVLGIYGCRAPLILELVREAPELGMELSAHSHAVAGELVFAFREEFATTLADALSRRLMVGLDPDLGRSALDAAVDICRRHLGWDTARADQEARRYVREAERLRTAL